MSVDATIATSPAPPVLSVRGLAVTLPTRRGPVEPVADVSFDLRPGEVLGIAGESGSGKSLTLKSVVGLLPRGARVRGQRLVDLGGGLTTYDPVEVRGHGVSVVFQEPATALNPTMRVGDLVAEGARIHRGLRGRAARERAVELMTAAGIPDAARRARMWPHELSGGLRQRVMIAAALSTGPRILLCDEPTTALDVSVQDQILGLLLQLRDRMGLSVVIVSHDLAVLGEVCDRVLVMYAGRVMEAGPVREVLAGPAHPYTDALVRASPTLDADAGALVPIPGQVPPVAAPPPGCRFAPRCRFVQDDCREADHRLREVGPGRSTACLHPQSVFGDAAAVTS